MVNLHVLHGLSFAGAEAFLLEEGYIQETVIEREALEDGRLFLYCRRDEDGEWEAYSCGWTRDL